MTLAAVVSATVLVASPWTPENQPPPFGLTRESDVRQALDITYAAKTAIGGYGELVFYTDFANENVVDLQRVVLFFGHNFSNVWRFYSEFEVEHAVASSDDVGEFEIEQAFIDGVFSKRIALRAGLIIMPMGIINQFHESPSFNGTQRPLVDTLIIPTTWREPGAGIFGEFFEGLTYQLYAVTGFNANGFTAESAIREGHQEASKAFGGDWGAIARLEYEPRLGMAIGLSAYGATSGNSITARIGKVPVGLFDIDFRFHHRGWSVRAQLAALAVGSTKALNEVLLYGSAEQRAAGPVSSFAWGGYAEVGYDLFQFMRIPSDMSLTLFLRAEAADTQASVQDGFRARPEFTRYAAVVGAVYRPLPQLGFKADYTHMWRGEGTTAPQLALAATWMF